MLKGRLEDGKVRTERDSYRVLYGEVRSESCRAIFVFCFLVLVVKVIAGASIDTRNRSTRRILSG